MALHDDVDGSGREQNQGGMCGHSVTWGLTIENRETACYPAQLQRLLGKGYEVRNFGHSGATLLRHGHRPYVEQKEYKEALDFKADVVVIHLGLNDTDPRNWPEYAEEFNQDYINLIHLSEKQTPKQRFTCAYDTNLRPTCSF